ncbi:streptogrisin C, Serine peptidase, MEROPS family S01A [Promicromonospora umidemergens]|uniref:ricin-type beta-trefoil lectin domain protein n=1 Tax=Promicromonospora umidemergens TaxID=629679 RepID=UPI0020A4E01C|nr:ricin-type beta-trefoil lectin domain protein [Promicromonospora umidemergens]MCP2282126.1 streptogrisin C, Serine peptidase, MEROPS family S01A [Promicromonospora umidemergens]
MSRSLRTSRPLIALSAAAFVVGTAFTGAGVAGAAPPPQAPAAARPAAQQPDELPDAQIRAMERDLGLTRAEIPDRLALDADAALIEAHLTAALGEAYAGTWLPQGADAPRVAVTSTAAAKVAERAGADAVVVEHGLEDLTVWKEALDEVGAPDSVHSWYADPTTNEVVVEAADVGAAKAMIAEADLPADVVRVERSKVAPEIARDIRGGDEFRRPTGDGFVTLCSIGFAVQGGFVTAGHCGAAGNPVTASDGAALGTYRASVFPGHDWAWVATNSNWTPTPTVNNYAGGTATVAGSAEQGIGATVCRSGRTTGWRCGNIQEKNVTINYGNGDIPGMATGSACAEGGDSGGSVISGNQAQGVTSGRIGDCSSNGRFIYQPLNPILSTYGLQLTTSGGGGGGQALVGLAGKCIDVPNADFSDGKRLQLWTCNGSAAQRWTFHADGTLRAGGKCMDIAWANTADGTAVQLANCSGNAAQQFTLSGAGDLVSILANKCVDVPNSNSANGTQLQIWTCNGTSAQKWRVG